MTDKVMPDVVERTATVAPVNGISAGKCKRRRPISSLAIIVEALHYLLCKEDFDWTITPDRGKAPGES